MRHAESRPGAPRPSSPGETREDQEDRPRSGQLPYWIMLAGAGVALATIRLGVHFLRSGTLVLAGVLLVAAVARLVLPDHRAGMLSSRRRLVDVVTFAVLGVGLLVMGLVVPTPR